MGRKFEFRIIQHLSHPVGSSMTDGMKSSVHYQNTDDDEQLIKKFAQGVSTIKIDIKDT